ncbi:MAG: tRNA (adenosine(37)-N6)-threonylcarbamoyltransferase complex dimerization subunit type 1 TsaB [Syntrophales bacterium]|jgi:tRNA threonylcarbamoyladenosine biosynthesis protein TsaB
MLTLAIDTSTKSASIALLRDSDILSEIFFNLDVNHSLVLLPALDHLLRLSRVEAGGIDLFACTMGPGSFTGLRVGASTVKGLALATGKPIAGVSTLEALAFNIISPEISVCPMLDAKKDQVYTALYRTGRDYTLEKIETERVTDVREFLCCVDEEVIFVGDGAVKYAGLISEILPGKSCLASVYHQHVRAAVVGLLGRKKYSEGDILDSVTFAPAYLRASEAEVKRFSR